MAAAGFRRWLSISALLMAAAALGGCAHPITLSPKLDGVRSPGGVESPKKVGLVMADSDRQIQTTSPGGGGDSVSYFPYRDMETGLYLALSSQFASVSRVSGPADPKIAAEGLSYLVTPRLVTRTSSDSALTWPPTAFTIELTCRFTDTAGNPVTQLVVVGEGRATFNEFKSDSGLSGHRAAEDVLKKLVKAMNESSALK